MEDTVTFQKTNKGGFPFISVWGVGRGIVSSTVALDNLLAFLRSF